MALTPHKPRHPDLKDKLQITREDGRIRLKIDPSLVPGSEDVLTRLDHASSPNALRELGHGNIRALIDRLDDEHRHLEASDGMQAEHRIVGDTIAALTTYYAQSAGDSLPNHLRSHVASSVDEVADLSFEALEEPKGVGAFARGVRNASTRVFSGVRGLRPAAKKTMRDLSLIGEIERGEFKRDEFERRFAAAGERMPPTEREQEISQLLMEGSVSEARKTASVISEFFEGKRSSYSWTGPDETALNAIDREIIPGLKWYQLNGAQTGLTQSEYMRELLDVYHNTESGINLRQITSGLRFDAPLMRHVNTVLEQRIGGTYVVPAYQYLSLCRNQGDVDRLFDAMSSGGLGSRDSFREAASNLDDLLLRHRSGSGDFAKKLYDRVMPQAPDEERQTVAGQLKRMDGMLEEYRMRQGVENKLMGLDSYADFKAVVPLVFRVADSADRFQELSGMTAEVAALTPRQRELFENALTAGYFHETDSLDELLYTDRDGMLLTGVCAAHPGREAQALNGLFGFIGQVKEHWHAKVAREAIDAELASASPDLPGVYDRFLRVRETAGSYHRGSAQPLLESGVLRAGMANPDGFQGAVEHYAGFSARLSEGFPELSIMYSIDNNAGHVIEAFADNPQAQELSDKLVGYLQRVTSPTGLGNPSYALNSCVYGGGYATDKSILAGAVLAYNASGRDMGVLDAVLDGVPTPDASQKDYLAELRFHVNSTIALTYALAGNPNLPGMLAHVHANSRRLGETFKDTTIAVPSAVAGRSSTNASVLEVIASSVGREGSLDDFTHIVDTAAAVIDNRIGDGGGTGYVPQRLGKIIYHTGDAASARKCVDWFAEDENRIMLLNQDFYPNTITAYNGGGGVGAFLALGSRIMDAATESPQASVKDRMPETAALIQCVEVPAEESAPAMEERILGVVSAVRFFEVETMMADSSGDLSKNFFESFCRDSKHRKSDVETPEALIEAAERLLEVPRMFVRGGHADLAATMLHEPERVAEKIIGHRTPASGQDTDESEALQRELKVEVGRKLLAVADYCTERGFTGKDKRLVLTDLVRYGNLLSDSTSVVEVSREVADLQVNLVESGLSDISGHIRSATSALSGEMSSHSEITSVGAELMAVAGRINEQGLSDNFKMVMSSVPRLAAKVTGPATVTQIGELLVSECASLPSDAYREDGIRALTGHIGHLKPGSLAEVRAGLSNVRTNLVEYKPYLDEQDGQLNRLPKFSFIPCTDAQNRLLTQPTESLRLLRAANYPPAFVLGVAGAFEPGELSPELAGRLVESLPRNCEVVKDEYNLEYCTSYINADRDAQTAILSGVLTRFPPLNRGEDEELLNVMCLADSLSSVGFSDRVLTQLGGGHESFTDFAAAVREDAVQVMSASYPAQLLRKQKPEDLTRFVSVYSTYEKTMHHFNDADKIPAMRAIAVVELLGKEEEFKRNDFELLRTLIDGAQSYFPKEDEREACVAYLNARAENKEVLAVLPPEEYSDAERARVLAAFNNPNHKLDYTLQDVCMEDRLNSTRRLLEDLFFKRHFSRALQDMEALHPEQENPMGELAKRWQEVNKRKLPYDVAVEQLREANAPRDEAAGEPKKKGGKKRKRKVPADVQAAADELKASVADLPPERQVTQLTARAQPMAEELSVIEGEQNRCRTWEGIRSIGVKYEGKIDALAETIDGYRSELGRQENAPVIEELGFAFHESFGGDKVYLGDVGMLSQAVDDALAQGTMKGRETQLKSLQQTIGNLQKAYIDAENYMTGLVPTLTETLGMLEKKREAVRGLEGRITGVSGFDEALTAVGEFDSRLAAHVSSRVNDEQVPPEQRRAFLGQVLTEYEDSSAIADIQSVIGAITADSGVKAAEPTIYTYGNEQRFSEMLLSMRGQCCDYRTSHNSIGNSPYNVALTDSLRNLVVGKDRHGTPRVDTVLYLSRVELEGKERACLVTDPAYVPDGSPLSWGKIEGHLRYAMETADATGLPLIIPSLPTEHNLKENIRKFEEMQDAEEAPFEEKDAKVRVLPSPSGGVYCEAVAFTSYEEQAVLDTKAHVYMPRAA
ncbi:MAG: hypothetical protein ABH834_06795 [Candidatus Altiarchaeota archaeon]